MNNSPWSVVKDICNKGTQAATAVRDLRAVQLADACAQTLQSSNEPEVTKATVAYARSAGYLAGYQAAEMEILAALRSQCSPATLHAAPPASSAPYPEERVAT